MARKKAGEALSGADVVDALTQPVRAPRASHAQYREALGKAVPAMKAQRDELAAKATRSKYSREIMLEVFDRMGGGETLNEILPTIGLAQRTFYEWLNKEGEEGLLLRELYARARQALADWAFGAALQAPRDLVQRALQPTKDQPPIDSSTVQAVRLMTDSLKWYAERLNPGIYAPQKETNQPTIHVTNQSLTIDARNLDASQRESLRQLLMTAKDGDGKLIEG